MWYSLCVSLYLVVIVKTEDYFKNESAILDPTSETPDSLYRSRCTRRFTPGVCEDPVTPVWTFVFHLQNCTERLGCPLSHRTNRFRTYKLCMWRCRVLVDVYLQILASENYTDIFYTRQQLRGKHSRREGDVIPNDNITLPRTEDDTDYNEIEETSSSGEPLFNLYYRDESDMEISVPPDIDYEVGQRQEDVPVEAIDED